MPDNQLLRRQSGGEDSHPFHFALANQDDRIRTIFGLTGDSPIPSVASATLETYYDHLVRQLSLPFDALCCEIGKDKRQLVHQIEVTELMDPRQNHNRGPHGLLCKARNHDRQLEIPVTELGLRDDSPNSQLLDDYTYWFVNWR
ncbi:MAG: hypothetical protein LLG00_07210 [Planctomycetaceae bacterium]|nr:hypothetical protein [Planctomycetaceae bacterium]